MKLTIALTALVASATVAVASFTHAPGTPDGIYAHYTDADGVDHTEWVSPLNTTAPAERRVLQVRAGFGVQCQGDVEVSSNDINNAQNSLGNSFGSGITFHKKISAVSGSAVAYGCDYGNGQFMTSTEYLGYMSAITTNCGSTVAGYYNLPSSKSSYGRTSSSVGFC